MFLAANIIMNVLLYSGLLLLALKKRVCFVILSISQAMLIWITIQTVPVAWGVVVMSCTFRMFNTFSWYMWSRDDRSRKRTAT